MLVKEFKELRKDGFSDAFYDSLPDICFEEGCGHPTEMLETLTQLRCSNPRCPAKIAERIDAIVKSLGVKDFGEQRIRSFVTANGITNPLIIFAYEPGEDGALSDDISLELSEKIYAQIQEKKSFTLAEYVRIANLPNVQTSANSIFGSFDDIEEAYRKLEEGGIPYIQSCLGVSGDASVRALKIYESLMLFKDDLVNMIDCVDIIRVNNTEMKYFKACVTGSVGCGYATKAQFYAKVNSMYTDLHVDFQGSVTSDVNYVIFAGGDMTRKVKKAYDMQASGKDVKIMNATEFVEEMKELMGGC